MNFSKSMDKSIFIFGAGAGSISEAIEICELAGYKKIYCVDNINIVKEKKIDGYEVIKLQQIYNLNSINKFIVCVHTPKYREKIVQQARSFSLQPVSVFHPSTILSRRAKISEKGVLIAPGSIIGSKTHISDFVIVNRGAIIGHHVKIGEFATIEGNASISGLCTIGKRSFLGTGSVVLPKVRIGKDCLIAAGAVVREDVDDNTMVAGVPAVVKKTNIEGYIGSF